MKGQFVSSGDKDEHNWDYIYGYFAIWSDIHRHYAEWSEVYEHV